MILWTAFITGLIGSLHCVGMCGPIALALPVGNQPRWRQISGKAAYNIGRITTYSLMGFLLGTFGWGLKLAGLQQGLSIAAGATIILLALAGNRKAEVFFQKPYRWLVGNRLPALFKSSTVTSLYAIGLLNGLLPCGFVYIGLIGSVATQNAVQGALYMVLFGLGTAPLMFAVTVVSHFISSELRIRLNRYIPVAAVIIGCLFILRGMNLGIPYLSPQLDQTGQVVKECCTPQAIHH